MTKILNGFNVVFIKRRKRKKKKEEKRKLKIRAVPVYVPSFVI